MIPYMMVLWTTSQQIILIIPLYFSFMNSYVFNAIAVCAMSFKLSLKIYLTPSRRRTCTIQPFKTTRLTVTVSPSTQDTSEQIKWLSCIYSPFWFRTGATGPLTLLTPQNFWMYTLIIPISLARLVGKLELNISLQLS